MSNVDLSLLTVRRTLLGAVTTTLSCSLLLNFLDYLRELLLRPFQLSGKPIQWICHPSLRLAEQKDRPPSGSCMFTSSDDQTMKMREFTDAETTRGHSTLMESTCLLIVGTH